jgi:hypothetical protein
MCNKIKIMGKIYKNNAIYSVGKGVAVTSA